MRRFLTVAAGAVLVPAAVIAAGDIPTRYSGAFPSVGNFTSIQGTFTGKSLALKYTFAAGSSFTPASASLSCADAPPTKSRCAGDFRSDDGRFKGRLSVTVTWSGGKPVAMDIQKN